MTFFESQVEEERRKKAEMERRWTEWGGHDEFPKLPSREDATTSKTSKAEESSCPKETQGSKYSEALKLVMEDNQRTME